MKTISLFFISLTFTWKLIVDVKNFESGDLGEMGFDIKSILDGDNEVPSNLYAPHIDAIEAKIEREVEALLYPESEPETFADYMAMIVDHSEHNVGGRRGFSPDEWEDAEIALDWRYSHAA